MRSKKRSMDGTWPPAEPSSHLRPGTAHHNVTRRSRPSPISGHRIASSCSAMVPAIQARLGTHRISTGRRRFWNAQGYPPSPARCAAVLLAKEAQSRQRPAPQATRPGRRRSNRKPRSRRRPLPGLAVVPDCCPASSGRQQLERGKSPAQPTVRMPAAWPGSTHPRLKTAGTAGRSPAVRTNPGICLSRISEPRPAPRVSR